ncbi:MAG TPA: hypothetical protein VGS60_19125, partial [Actinomycetes bacterium]|nr:hypothetical protein [Actinomycetes bacterium]
MRNGSAGACPPRLVAFSRRPRRMSARALSTPSRTAIQRRLARLRNIGSTSPPDRHARSALPNWILWVEWLRDEVLAEVAHRHVVLTIPRLLRPLFRRRRELLKELARAGAEAVRE